MNKQKIIILSLVVIVAILFLYFSVSFLNKNIHPLWNANIFNVSAEPPLNDKKIKIYFGVGVNTINREDDSDLFNNMQKYTILYNGVENKEMINEYGENDFLITYDDNYYFSFRQFKTNRNAQHTYNIKMEEQDGKPFLHVEINGSAPMSFSASMIAITDAEQYRCNVPKEEAGAIYNMVELVKE